jgi:hypothetical protein
LDQNIGAEQIPYIATAKNAANHCIDNIISRDHQQRKRGHEVEFFQITVDCGFKYYNHSVRRGWRRWFCWSNPVDTAAQQQFEFSFKLFRQCPRKWTF